MNWAESEVLVTGAGGFVGSHLVEALIQRGARVRAFIRYTSRGNRGFLESVSPEAAARMTFILGDLRDPDAVQAACRGATTIFHLGALIAIPYSYLHPREVVETNVMGTLNVLESARNSRVPRVVHVSTSEVYGTARAVPMSEDHPLHGQSPYSASKIGADKVAESYYSAFGVPVVTVRPFNTFGPRQSARAVIPTIISQVLVGGTVKLGSLAPARDFTFVSDTVRGLIAAAEANIELCAGTTFNIGSDQEITIGTLAKKIMRLVGRDLPITEDSARTRPMMSEVQRLRADTTKARDVLRWAPSVSLEDGLLATIDWINRHPHLYRPGIYQI